MIHPAQWKALALRSLRGWIDDGASSMGAAIAFYTLLSMAPLLLIVLTIAGLFFGDEAARGALHGQLAQLVGADGAAAIEGILGNAGDLAGGLVSLLVGVLTLFIGATTVFAELQTDIDRIWKVQAPRGAGVLGYLRQRLMSFGVILGVGFLLMVSLVVSAVIAALGSLWERWWFGTELLLQLLNFALGFALITALFALIYKLLPSRRIAWSDVWVGAAVTSLLFGIGKFLIGLYLGKAAIASSFGAAGALVVVIVWVYYSAQTFLLGAEFTYQYARSHGSLAPGTT